MNFTKTHFKLNDGTDISRMTVAEIEKALRRVDKPTNHNKYLFIGFVVCCAALAWLAWSLS